MATVLIVDDEPDIVLFARVTLEMAGYDVIEAGDGEAGLVMVREKHPDAVLLDVMMPYLDGWGVLERLKTDPDPLIRTIPVVMLTALGSDHDQARGGIEGAVIYLPKPVAPDAIVAAVGQAIDGDPEPVQRKAAQQRALERLARMERGGSGAATNTTGPRPRFAGLEHRRSGATAGPPGATGTFIALTETQRSLLRTLRRSASVSEAAISLEVSRSNIYASLRRIGRKLDEPDVSVLLRRLRAGELDAALEG